MLAYYPLEHLYYLLSHDIIPDKITLPSITAFIPFIRTKPSSKNIPLDLGKLGLWSTRFWAAYVVLQLAHLREDNKLLQLRERTLSKTKVRAIVLLAELVTHVPHRRLGRPLLKRMIFERGAVPCSTSSLSTLPTFRSRFTGTCLFPTKQAWC